MKTRLLLALASTSAVVAAFAPLAGANTSPAAGGGNRATVQRATLPSGIDGIPMICDEQRVNTGVSEKDTFHCQYPGPTPSSAIKVDETGGSFWFSDFDGFMATTFQYVLAPNGAVNGWAVYCC